MSPDIINLRELDSGHRCGIWTHGRTRFIPSA